MVDSTDGVIVEVGVDTTKLTSGITQAKSQFNQFTTGLNTSLAQSTAAMSTTASAADKMGKSTKELGAAIGETGSRRELRESMTLLRSSMEGTGGAMEALKVLTITFGQSLGGPALIGITAGIAAIGALTNYILEAIKAEKELKETAEALNLPIESLRTYTSGMKELAFTLTSARLGLTDLNQSQVNLLTALGIDPNDADAARKILVAIENQAVESSEKIRQISIAFGGISYDKALEKQNAFQEESKKSANSYFQDLVTTMARAQAAEAGVDIPENYQTKGDVNGNKPNSNGKVGEEAKSQKQIDDERRLQDTLTTYVDKGTSARIAAMQNEAEKIIAEAEKQTEDLMREANKRADETNDAAAKAKILAGAGDASAEIMAEARKRSVRVAHQQALDEQTRFGTEMANLTNAANSADLQNAKTAGERIIAEGAAKIAALKKQLQDYYNSPEFQKLNATDQAGKRSQLDSQFSRSSSTITADSAAKAQQADLDVQLSQEKEFQSQMKGLVDAGENARVAAITDASERIKEQGLARIKALQEQYAQDLVMFQKNLADKKISQDEYDQRVASAQAAFSKSSEQIQTATAQQVVNANEKPMDSLLATWNNTTKQMASFSANALQSTSNSIVNFLMTGKFQAAQFAQAIVADLMKIAVEKEIAGIVGSIMGSFAGGDSTAVTYDTSSQMDSLTNSVSTGFAGGGKAQAGVPTWFGERGPELFIPDVGGTVMSNSASTAPSTGVGGNGAGAGSVTVTINNQGTAQKAMSATPQQTATGLVISIITQDLNSGGPMSSGIAQTFGLRRAVNT